MSEDLVQIRPAQRKKECVVKDCKASSSAGVIFFGDLCCDCYAFVAGYSGGENSQAFRNAMGCAGAILRERSIHVVASQILMNYHKGVLKWRKRPEEYGEALPPMEGECE